MLKICLGELEGFAADQIACNQLSDKSLLFQIVSHLSFFDSFLTLV